jgi:hypothetical protein
MLDCCEICKSASVQIPHKIFLNVHFSNIVVFEIVKYQITSVSIFVELSGKDKRKKFEDFYMDIRHTNIRY